MSVAHVLIVDDDSQIRSLLREYLERHNYRVSEAREGNEMQRALKRANIDLVVLDIMLPGDDGITLCRQLRQESDVMIIMLSAVAEEADRVIALEVGADDYLAKPFSPRELLARIKALTRRAKGELGESRRMRQLAEAPPINFEGWQLDPNKRHLVDKDGVAVPLTSAEYDLLLAFLEHPNRVLTRDQLLDITKGKEAQPFDRTIDVQVARLRKKLEVDPKYPQILLTVRGGGYQFTADVNRV